MPKAPARVVQSKYWCFTWNNYPESWKEDLTHELITSWSYGEEVGESGTPHIQGYLETSKKVRPFTLRLPKDIHWEKRKGTRQEAADYCQKDGKYICSKDLRPARKTKVIEILRPWQQEIADLCETEADDRTINWYWESTGGAGKSAMVRWLVKNNRCVMGAGKAADMKYSIIKHYEDSGYWPEVVIFDVPRTSLQYLSYTGIEEIKNGCFSSSKYESQTVLFPHPHVIIFANEEPIRSNMSRDRWSVHHIAHI